MKAPVKPIAEREEYIFDSFRRELLSEGWKKEKHLTTVNWLVAQPFNATGLKLIF